MTPPRPASTPPGSFGLWVAFAVLFTAFAAYRLIVPDGPQLVMAASMTVGSGLFAWAHRGGAGWAVRAATVLFAVAAGAGLYDIATDFV